MTYDGLNRRVTDGRPRQGVALRLRRRQQPDGDDRRSATTRQTYDAASPHWPTPTPPEDAMRYVYDAVGNVIESTDRVGARPAGRLTN
jgi:hypothetical protein